MIDYKNITGTLIDPMHGTRINLGELHNVNWQTSATQPLQRQMTTQQLMQELSRRKAEARELAARALAEKAERDKKRLHEMLSEEAVFSITYVPYVIAEVAWDYADSIIDIATLMRLSETKRLCRAIKELRREYDRERYKIINDTWRKSETDNMIMFQEELKDFFSSVHRYVSDGLTEKYGKIDYDSLLLIGASYACRIVLTALDRFCAAQEKIVTSILGYSIGHQLMPKEIKKLYAVVAEFDGDTTLDRDDWKQHEAQFAEELAKYITDVELNDVDKSTKSTNKSKTKMTMEEMTSLVAEINATLAEFQKNLDLNVNKDNKAAGVRARKASVKLEKLMKTYRKNSVK